MIYTPEQRNFDNIQFMELRKKVDQKFNDVHDELSDCFYNKKPFREYGILTKEIFDKLHGLIFLLRDAEFHKENIKQPAKGRIPEAKYNDILDEAGNFVNKKSIDIENKILQLKTEGINLTI